jgi:hypothetical protein
VTKLSDAEVARVHARISDVRLPESCSESGVNAPEFELALGFIRVILNGLPQTFETLKQPLDGDMPKENRGRFALEEILFCLHLIVRFTFSQEELQQRESFMDIFVGHVATILWQSCGLGIELSRFFDYFIDLYNARSEEYTGYRDSTAEGESRRGELLWEHGKRMDALFRPSQSALRISLLTQLEMRFMEKFIPLVRRVQESK